MAFAGMIINVSLNIYLIPRYQAFGSAYASLFTQIVTAGAQVAMAVYIFKLKPDYMFIFRLLAFVGATVALAFISSQFANWFYGYIFLIATSVFSAFLFGLFKIGVFFKTLLAK
jgi:peptidoglycan biosynthesis protein MviN/MurJ (putative lipid II flippase)